MLGTVRAVEDIDDAVTVGAVVDAVLVLHHDHVEGVERPRRGDNAGRLPVHHDDATTSTSVNGSGRSSTRTTPVSWPAVAISARRAAVNVASPHCVGG